uniref:V-SNARE coiled-coil homology domain-containing protein n=1 Tax=Dicentrarchus labrax TaxID=13489 RepID=A0A8C4NQ27_DICLA
MIVTDDNNNNNNCSRLQQAQEDVEEVKVIMLDNLSKADERGDKLDDLEGRADELLEKVTQSYFSQDDKHKLYYTIVVTLHCVLAFV